MREIACLFVLSIFQVLSFKGALNLIIKPKTPPVGLRFNSLLLMHIFKLEKGSTVGQTG